MSAPHSSCRLCVSLIGPTYENLYIQVGKAVQYADWVELRLDYLTHIDLDKLRQLREKFPIPMIFTLRKEAQGGKFVGSEEKRYALLSALLHLNPEYIDIEADIPPNQFNYLKTLSTTTQWILSWHDFEVTPVQLQELFNFMKLQIAQYYKIATQANSIGDAFRVLRLAKEINQTTPLLSALCMGELGQCTRILAPIVGCPFTYASVEESLESAAGQLTAQTLVDVYHFRQLNRQTLIFGLIGDPVDKSKSHLTHNAVFRKLGLNAVYIKFKVIRDEIVQFFVTSSILSFKGLSVTMPLKEAVMTFIQKVDLALKAIRSVNTLSFQDNEIIGCNTDGKGAIKALGVKDLKGKRVVILGAGGTAKAIAYEARRVGASLTILNRTKSRAQELAKNLDCRWGGLEDLPKLAQKGYDILIQATPVGMSPDVDQMPISLEDLLPQAIILDAISNPRETKLLQEARLKGCKTIGGEELFIYQAIEQFAFWFGSQSIDLKLVEKTIREYLTFPPGKNDLIIHKSHLSGDVWLPSSKSHTIRAILLGALTEGTSTIHNPLYSPDTRKALQAAHLLGAKTIEKKGLIEIKGVAGEPVTPENILDAGNSGQVLRFAAAFAALGPGYTVLTGDESIRSNRPIQPLIEGLQGLGVFAESTRQDGYAPLIVKGPLKAGKTNLNGEDSQPVSALLMAASFVEGETEITVKNPGETPWINLTLSWLERLGINFTNEGFERFVIQGSKKVPAFQFSVPGDFSSAAFPIVAALLTHSNLTVQNVDMDDVQGDKALLDILIQMGAQIEIDRAHRCLYVYGGSSLKGCVIDVNPVIDAITILAVLGCFSEGETRLINGSIAHYKECDRIACISSELKKMGAAIQPTEDGLIIHPSRLRGAKVKSYGDHRMALSLAIAGLASEGETIIEDIRCINKSYPTFIADMIQLGAQFHAL